jgi:hypothetical protein
VRDGGPGLISTVLLSRESQAVPGTTEEKVRVLCMASGSVQKAVAIHILVSLSMYYKR